MFSIEGKTAEKESKRRRIEINTETGLIEKVSEPTGEADIILKEEIIFPGFIDLHVHAREDVSHKNDYKEDFVSAGEAAISGGVVAIADMPNNPVPPVDEKSYSEKENLTKKSKVDVLLYAGIGRNTEPLSKNVPYKVFMGHSVGDLFFTSREALEKILENYIGKNVSFHAEDPEILEKNKNKPSHETQRPEEAEIKAVNFALQLIRKYNLEGKICHVSTARAIEEIIQARKEGLKVTVEVAPHHLFFDETMIKRNGKIKFQVNPPIRHTRENRLKLIKYLKDGLIDYLATDHAPHTIIEKEKGISGFSHLDTFGPFTTWLIKEHNFSLEDVARVCAKNPGNFINKFQDEKYGKIEAGYVGSLTILDLEKETKVTKEILKTKCGWSPFLGFTFPGSVYATIIKGKVFKNNL